MWPYKYFVDLVMSHVSVISLIFDFLLSELLSTSNPDCDFRRGIGRGNVWAMELKSDHFYLYHFAGVSLFYVVFSCLWYGLSIVFVLIYQFL